MDSIDLTPVLSRLQVHFTILGYCLIAIWSVSVLNFLLNGQLNRFALRPRTSEGLVGIVFSAFLHGSWRHLLNNTPPFLILGWFILLLQGPIDFWIVTLVSEVLSGIATWCLGGAGRQIGASRLIFAYFGFLLLRGYFQESTMAVLASIATIFLYGWTLQLMVPRDRRPDGSRMSWEGHLFGFVSGIVVARYLEDLRPFAEWIGTRLQSFQ
ncbi:MAG: rhomboid family intramembrane serine protease [Leptolyngbyaceae cyanobacterium bins.59]|nr:rhomboid family intramembrane serine protease [Leptolyngbyaceae cyanobacterium bins.59]